MAYTDINSEDRLVQKTFAEHLRDKLGWDSVYAWNEETFGPTGTLGRVNEREVVLLRDLRSALTRLNPALPEHAREQAIEKLTRVDFSRSLLQHNREFYGCIRNGVPVEWREEGGETRHARAKVIDFRDVANNRLLAVRELKIQGLRVPHYNRRADLVCFVNGLLLVFIELKAVYRNIRAGFDDNLTDYLNEHSIAQAFYHNAFLVVSNGDRARYGSITSKWEHFTEWKRNSEKEMGRVEAEVFLDGMLAKERLLDFVENFIAFDDSKPGGMRKIVARNHQVLGVNNAVASVIRQEQLKKAFPPGKRLIPYEGEGWQGRLAAEGPFEHGSDRHLRRPSDPEQQKIPPGPPLQKEGGRGVWEQRGEREVLARGSQRDFSGKSRAREREKIDALPLVRRAHPDLGRLGVFWHTQGQCGWYASGNRHGELRHERMPLNRSSTARGKAARWMAHLCQSVDSVLERERG